MKKEFITNNKEETQVLGEELAGKLKNGGIICLTGELGSGKTTFTQGLLKGLKIKEPHTSPTFVIMKKYGKNIYHIDAYRVKSEDIINLGWEEMIKEKNSVIIIEWAERIKNIIPPDASWIEFEWLDENRRRIIFKNNK